MGNNFLKAQERKKLEQKIKEEKSLRKQVEDLKKEIADGKAPLKLKIEQFELQIEELKQEVRHYTITLNDKERWIKKYESEIAVLKKELEEALTKLKAYYESELEKKDVKTSEAV